MSKLLEIDGLESGVDTEGGLVRAVDGVSFELEKGRTLGIVGESGCGKTVTAMSIVDLLPKPAGRVLGGNIRFKGRELRDADRELMYGIRGNEIGVVFQEPMAALNPVQRVGKQIIEALLLHRDISKHEALKRAVELLEAVGIPSPESRISGYPHQLSGGMRQRVMIAIALALNPALLIADEPTTALDVTIQAQILDLMKDLQREREGSSVMLITHDLAVLAETCDRVIVMYGGRIQEVARVTDLFDAPLHPYTKGLLGSIPTQASKGKPLPLVEGNVPSIFNFPSGCRFRSRCPLAEDRCASEEPALRTLAPGHEVRCHLVESADIQTSEAGA